MTCSGCAWARPGGRCAFHADPGGEPVDVDGGGCAFREELPACAPCGACCREAFDAVPVDADEGFRAAHPALVTTASDGFCSIRRTPLADGSGGTRCAGLSGDGSAVAPFRCTVYADRPRACRHASWAVQ